MSEWLYVCFEPGLWTVGHYSPSGEWQPVSDHGSDEEAAKRVRYLNGGLPEASAASGTTTDDDLIEAVTDTLGGNGPAAVAALAAVRDAGWRIARVDEDWVDDGDGRECWAITEEWEGQRG